MLVETPYSEPPEARICSPMLAYGLVNAPPANGLRLWWPGAYMRLASQYVGQHGQPGVLASLSGEVVPLPHQVVQVSLVGHLVVDVAQGGFFLGGQAFTLKLHLLGLGLVSQECGQSLLGPALLRLVGLHRQSVHLGGRKHRIAHLRSRYRLQAGQALGWLVVSAVSRVGLIGDRSGRCWRFSRYSRHRWGCCHAL